MTDDTPEADLQPGPVPGTVAKRGPLAGWLDDPRIDRFDRRVDAWADRLRGHAAADRLFYGLSTAGDHGMIWHAVGLGRVAVGADTFRQAVELSAGLGVEAALVNGPVKMLFRRVRPVHEGERPRHLRRPRTSSFPSGHASAGTFAAVLVAERSRFTLPWFVLGVAIGWSRVHVRIHHPSDVLGGTVVGWILGKFALRAIGKLNGR